MNRRRLRPPRVALRHRAHASCLIPHAILPRHNHGRAVLRRYDLLFAVILVISLLPACASNAPGPYAPRSEAFRDTNKAQRLNHEAAAILTSDPDRAERLLRDALTADLYFGPAHNNLGVVYLNKGMLYEAAGEFEWARKLMPGHPDPRLNLALVLERAGRTDEALATYATALEVYPDHIPTIQALASLQLRANKPDDRTPAYLDDITLRGQTQAWRDWARMQRLKSRP